MTTKAKTDAEAQSQKTPIYYDDDEIIKSALRILENRVKTPGEVIENPNSIKNLLSLKNYDKDKYRERFMVVFLDSMHRVISTEVMFEGTLNSTSVYPREIVRAAIKHNASAVILSHNHPSGNLEPSLADESLTNTVKSALATIDCRVLDHIITSANGEALSFAEKGLI